jgi:quercetin dioxygenase-like cupin family protein
VEILKTSDEAAQSAKERALDLGHGHLEDVVVDNQQIRVTEVQILPGAETDASSGRLPQVLVSLSDAEFENIANGKSGGRMKMKSGEVLWVPRGDVHTLRNAGGQLARYVAVDFK